MANIDVFDHYTNKYVTYRFLIDTLSSVFWLISSQCQSDICNLHNKYTPVHSLGPEASIDLNTGKVSGNIYFTSVNLRNFILNGQSLFLANSISVKEFEDSNIDGVLGLSKFLSSLHKQPTYSSILQNIINKNLPNYVILRLGGNEPYIKFGNMDSGDWQYMKVDKNDPVHTEHIEWLDLIENGKLVLPLRHIRLVYRDKLNKEIKSEFALTHCIHHGCRATLDTKAFYIYGPENQLEVIMNVILIYCRKY
jgi:hypothetical protein